MNENPAQALSTSDGQDIAYYHYSCGNREAVVIAHGFYNSKDSVLLQKFAHALEAYYDIFIFDFRGHGQSSGLFTWTSREEIDLSAVLEKAKARYPVINVIAFSLGAAVALNVAARTQLINSLVCISAPYDTGRIDYRFWELDIWEDFFYTLIAPLGRRGKGVRPGPFWLKKTKPLDSVKKLTTPVLYLHGDKDWVVRPKHSVTLHKATSSFSEISIIAGGPHAEYLLKKHQDYIVARVKDWFTQSRTMDKKT
jgi:pimeloyl-ACP methyl ester carboxylesterase